jgi:hypothetical protein
VELTRHQRPSNVGIPPLREPELTKCSRRGRGGLVACDDLLFLVFSLHHFLSTHFLYTDRLTLLPCASTTYNPPSSAHSNTQTHIFHNGKPNGSRTRQKQHELIEETNRFKHPNNAVPTRPLQRNRKPSVERTNPSSRKPLSKRVPSASFGCVRYHPFNTPEIWIWMDTDRIAIVALLFVVCGGLIFELLRIIVGYF